MKTYNNSGRNNSDKFRSRNRNNNQMHDAVCDDCGRDCKIPFMPSSGKPIYCSDCFEKRGNGRNNENRRSNFSDRRGSSDRGNRHQENYNKQFEALNAKLDKILNILEAKK